MRRRGVLGAAAMLPLVALTVAVAIAGGVAASAPRASAAATASPSSTAATAKGSATPSSAAAAPASATPATEASPEASGTPALPKQALKPIDIDADVFEVNGKTKTGVFKGNVVARQGDVTIRATRVEAVYSNEVKGITKAVAEGGVTVTSGTKVGKADRAEFDNGARTVVLTGEPRLWEEGSVLEGKQIIFHVDDGRVECFECSIDVDPSKVPNLTNDALKNPGTP